MSDFYRVVRTNLSGESLDGWSPRDKAVRNNGLLLVVVMVLPALQAQNGTAPLTALAGIGLLVLALLRPNTGYARVYQGAILQARHAANMKVVKKRVKQPSYKAGKYDDVFVSPIRQDVIEVKDEHGVKHRIPVLRPCDPEIPYDFVYIRVKGGKFVANHNQMLLEAVDELASIVDTTLSLTDLTAGVTPLYIRAPHDMYEDYRYFEEHGNPLITHPDSFEILDAEQAARIERQREAADEYAQMVQAYGMADDWCLFVITIRRDRTTSSLYRGGEVPEDEVYNLPVLLLARSLAGRLRASTLLGYDKVEILREHDLCLMVRQAWDVVGIHDFYKQVAPYRRLLEDGLLTEEEYADVLWSKIGCLPRTFNSDHPEYAVVDGNYTSMIRLVKLPEYLYPSVETGMLRLGFHDVWLRSCSIGISGSASAERTRLYGKKASTANFASAFLSWLVIVPDTVEERKEELDEQTRQLRRVPLVQRYERYAALVSHSAPRLAEGRSDYIGTVRAARYTPDVINLTSLHQEKWLAACFGIQM